MNMQNLYSSDLKAPIIHKTYSDVSIFIWVLKKQLNYAGSFMFWILNEEYEEIYYLTADKTSDYDLTIDLYNAMLNEYIVSASFNIHDKQRLLDFFSEVPGIVYTNKTSVFKQLYKRLMVRFGKYKRDNSEGYKNTVEKLEYIREVFPEFAV